MGDLEDEIKRLYARTERTRYEFLKNEVQSCRTALEMGESALSVGNTESAQNEVGFVTKGIATVRRFLPLTAAEQQLEIGQKLAEIEAALFSLQAKLKRDAGELN